MCCCRQCCGGNARNRESRWITEAPLSLTTRPFLRLCTRRKWPRLCQSETSQALPRALPAWCQPRRNSPLAGMACTWLPPGRSGDHRRRTRRRPLTTSSPHHSPRLCHSRRTRSSHSSLKTPPLCTRGTPRPPLPPRMCQEGTDRTRSSLRSRQTSLCHTSYKRLSRRLRKLCPPRTQSTQQSPKPSRQNRPDRESSWWHLRLRRCPHCTRHSQWRL